MDRPEISNDHFQASLIYARSYGCSRWHLLIGPVRCAICHTRAGLGWAFPSYPVASGPSRPSLTPPLLTPAGCDWQRRRYSI